MGGQAPGLVVSLTDIPPSLSILDDMAKRNGQNETLYIDSVFNFTYVLRVKCLCWRTACARV
jgi:hypothetical protein